MAKQELNKAAPTDVGNDRLWVGQYPIIEVFKVFENPKKWVRDHVAGLQYGLREPFVISVLPLGKDQLVDKREVLIQGIDGTNLITIQATGNAGRQFLVDWQEYFSITPQPKAVPYIPPDTSGILKKLVGGLKFKAFLKDFEGKDLDIAMIDSYGKAYIHYEIWTPSMVPGGEWTAAQIRSEKRFYVALYHLHAATHSGFIHHVLEHSGKHKKVMLKPGNGTLTPDPNAPIPKEIKFNRPGKTVPLLMSGDSTSDATACEMLIARYEAGEITYEEAYCKDYATPIPLDV